VSALELLVWVLAVAALIVVLFTLAAIVAAAMKGRRESELRRLRAFHTDVMFEAQIAGETGVASSIIMRAHDRHVILADS